MRVIYKIYESSEQIPVYDYISRRKLVKYFTRETMVAMVCAGELLKERKPLPETPFFYSSSELEMMDIYNEACSAFDSDSHNFTSSGFMERALPVISPLSHFKSMRNMTHCFISIEHGFKGDNASLIGSASGLLLCAMLSTTARNIIIGAGKLHADGTAEAGFAEVTSSELAGNKFLESNEDAISFFRVYHNI